MSSEKSQSTFSFVADETDAGERLDLALVRRFPDWSRSAYQRLIRAGEVRVNGEAVRPNYPLQPGDAVAGEAAPAVPAEPAAEAIPLDVVYHDDDLIVINKPPGLVVHPAAGNPDGTLVNALLHHFEFLSGVGGVQRPGIVHRLDKDTSGLMLVARNDAAHQRLQAMIEERTLRRRYLALLQGELTRAEGRIAAPLGRHPRQREKMAVVREEDGREALTLYRRLESGLGFSLAEATLQTGRTHQIRVHFAHIGFPVVGDAGYGYNREKALSAARRSGRAGLETALTGIGRQMLHAWRLELAHPRTGAALAFAARPPEDFERVVKELEWSGKIKTS